MAELIKNASWSDIRRVIQDPTVQVGLFGPPGVGKTHALFEAGLTPTVTQLKTNGGGTRPITRHRYVGKVQFHSEMSPSEVMGMHVPDGDKFRWESGPADLAYSKGGLLILDEIDQGSGPMKTYLYGLLDRGPGGTISYVGRTFTQTPGYQAVATMNDWPDQGALPDALLNRFDCWFMVAKPSDEQLALLDPDLRQLCRDCYDTASDPMRGPDISFRLLYGLQKIRKYLPLETAVLGACKNNTVLAGSLLEVLALTDPAEDVVGVTAASAPVGPVGSGPLMLGGDPYCEECGDRVSAGEMVCKTCMQALESDADDEVIAALADFAPDDGDD